MSRAADDKAIDEDLEEMSLFLVGQSGWFNAEERHYQERMEAMVSQADPARVDAVEAGYQACLKNCKDVHAAHSMFNRLRAEIKRLRKESYSVLLSSLCLDIQTATGKHADSPLEGHSSKDCAKLISDGIKGLGKDAGKANVARRMLVMLARLQDVKAFDMCGKLGKVWSKQVTEWIEEARGRS